MPYVGKLERQAIDSLLATGAKRCGQCGEVKPVFCFNLYSRNKTAFRPDCKACHNAASRARYIGEKREITLARQRETNKTDHRRAYCRKYQRERCRGERERLADRPRPEACEVCGLVGPVYYDHDHATGKRIGKFRGWLCVGCNSALGYAKDNPETLRRLADYIEAYQKGRAK